ncbi:MAG TPA: helix-turn-helix transcriptional regulator, partial [Candidatus Baltobacteraceae bacterium]|nr:helix-turn-helix transcriptional regulator [Candidatus Baltobacteraceae bacterium]
AALRRDYDPRTEIRLRVHFGYVMMAQGDATAALDLVESQIGRAYALGFGDELCLASSAAMYVLAGLERFDEAARWGDYALGRPEPKSPSWIAVLSYNMATLEIQRGKPVDALARLDALESGENTLRTPDQPMVSMLRVNALIQLDRYDDAASLLREALGSETPAWVRLELRNAEALLHELRDDFQGALELATFVMRQPSTDSNSKRSRVAAAAMAARIRYRLNRVEMHEELAICDEFSAHFAQARAARAIVETYVRLAQDPSAENARELLAAVERTADRFTRALDAFEAAKILADRTAFTTLTAEFESIGSARGALRVRAEAALRGVGLSRRVARRPHLTERELELAHHVAAGRTNAEIARILRRSRKTVDNHVSNILAKCGARSRVDIAALVIRGKLPVESPQ